MVKKNHSVCAGYYIQGQCAIIMRVGPCDLCVNLVRNSRSAPLLEATIVISFVEKKDRVI